VFSIGLSVGEQEIDRDAGECSPLVCSEDGCRVPLYHTSTWDTSGKRPLEPKTFPTSIHKGGAGLFLYSCPECSKPLHVHVDCNNLAKHFIQNKLN
jgi:hypothetical protein